MDVWRELQRATAHLPAKARPIPVALAGVGQVGLAHPRFGGVRLNPRLAPLVEAAWREHVAADRLCREYSSGRLGADEVLPVLARGTDCREALATIKRQRAAITSWDGLIGARGAGRYFDFCGFKASQTTVANVWSCFARSTGVPGAAIYTAIPGGAAHNASSAGAMPIVTSHGATDDVYLANVGLHHATGTNIVLLADLLVACGNISATTTGAQTVNSATLPRATTGDNVAMILEVTTALGGTASNVTVTYTNQSGTSGRTTNALAMTTSAIVFRTQPVAGGIVIPLQAGDYGVRSVQTVTFSAAMGAGVVALLLYQPLVLLPTLATTTFVERSTPAQLAGMVRLTAAPGGTPGCLIPFVLTSTTSTGVQTYFLQYVWG